MKVLLPILKDFFVFYISRLRKVIEHRIFFKDVPLKALQKLYQPIAVENQKSLSNIFNMM